MTSKMTLTNDIDHDYLWGDVTRVFNPFLFDH